MWILGLKGLKQGRGLKASATHLFLYFPRVPPRGSSLEGFWKYAGSYITCRSGCYISPRSSSKCFCKRRVPLFKRLWNWNVYSVRHLWLRPWDGLSNPSCLSLNLAASKGADGKFWCELLTSDKYINPCEYKDFTSLFLEGGFNLSMVGR